MRIAVLKGAAAAVILRLAIFGNLGYFPEMDDDKGTSGILIQSAKGVWGNETEYSVQVSFA